MTRLLALLILTSLACTMSSQPVSPAPLPTPTASLSAVAHPVPTIPPVVGTNIRTVTALHIRECAGLSCDVVNIVPAGTMLSAFCNGEWCMVPAYGWFCLPAAIGTGGCE